MSLRVAYLVAGAGGMYCGSCLRDNRLAATLIGQGRDVSLIPLYTPIRTDERDVSISRVHYGGINAFLQQMVPVFRHTPRFVDAVFDAPSLLKAVGKYAAGTRPDKLGAMTVSVLQGEDGAQRKELDRLIAFLKDLRPDIVNLPNLMFLGAAAPLRDALNVPVVCSLAGEDIFLDAIPDPHRSAAFRLIADHAQSVDAFLAPTRYYAEHVVNHFRIPADRIRYVPMGICLEGYLSPDLSLHPESSVEDRCVGSEGAFTIGYFARICPEKGLDLLADAWMRLRRGGRFARLRVAGYLGPGDRSYLAEIQKRISAEGYGADFEYVGEPDLAGKIAFLESLHVLSVPARYAESKGFYVVESLAAGTPVVQPAHGSFPELVHATGGGLLYPAGSESALADAMSRLMDAPDERRCLAIAGHRAAHRLFGDRVMAEATWSVYESVCGPNMPESAAG